MSHSNDAHRTTDAYGLSRFIRAQQDDYEPALSEIFGSPDDLKLKSSATLFASVSPPGSVFDRLLEKYFQGARDGKTLELMGIDHETGNAT